MHLVCFDTQHIACSKTRSCLIYRHACAVLLQDTGKTASIIKSPLGKPYFLEDQPDQPLNLLHNQVSVSHTRNLSAFLYTQQICGIDCETVRTRRNQNILMLKLLQCLSTQGPEHTQALREEYFSLLPSQKLLAFYRMWTFAEAYCKLHGWSIWHFFQRSPQTPCVTLYDLLAQEVIAYRSLWIHYAFPRTNIMACCLTLSPSQPTIQFRLLQD